MTLGGDGGNTWIKNNHKEETSKKEEIVVEETPKTNTTHKSVEVRLEGLTKVFVDSIPNKYNHFFIIHL